MSDNPIATVTASVDAPDSRVHYDVPARIFELLLDPHMNYSSGIYGAGIETLADAQIAKMQRIGAWLKLSSGMRLLDIGCGWCGPGLYLAETHGVTVTGVTPSPVQRDYALEWARKRGLGEALTVEPAMVLDLDFPESSFDAIMFLESIIHMPEKDRIFAKCHGFLRPGGRILIQESNYNRDSLREKYRRDRGYKEFDEAFGYTTVLMSAGRMFMELEEAGLVPVGLDHLSEDYVRTLSTWLTNLDTHEEEIKAVSLRAYTMLRRYLMLALATYRAGGTVCHIMVAEKPT